MSLSHRAVEAARPHDGYLFWQIIQNLWDSESNPDGFVSLGVAENSLMHDVLAEHIHTSIALPLASLTYGDGAMGSKRLRLAMARFLTRHLKPIVPIKSDHLIITNGCSSAVEHLSWALGNPGDAFLVGRPFYGTFLPDLTARTSCNMLPVSFHGVDPLGMDAVAKYESTIQEAQLAGQKVAALVLCHPHNPLGRCYPRAVIEELMRLCQNYRIHLVSDEIYALSTWSIPSHEATPFESLLSINRDGLLDPSMLHVVWGMSKDFGANGIRIGAIISQANPLLHASMTPVALYSSSSSVSDHLAANILEDDAWVEDYIIKNRKQLAAHLEITEKWAEKNKVAYMAGVNSAFFLWVDLGAAYRERHPDRVVSDIDHEVTSALLKAKVFLASGKHFGSEQQGWYRIVFSQKKPILEEGLGRIMVALRN